VRSGSGGLPPDRIPIQCPDGAALHERSGPSRDAFAGEKLSIIYGTRAKKGEGDGKAKGIVALKARMSKWFDGLSDSDIEEASHEVGIVETEA